MVRTALRIYKKNIWEIFALIGFVSLGIFVGLFIIIPAISSMVSTAYNNIVQAAKSVSFENFDANAFLNSLVKQFSSLDWAHPLQTIQSLFENGLLQNIINTALADGHLGLEQISAMKEVIDTSINNLASCITNQFIVFVTCIGVAAVVGYLLTKLVIYIRSTSNKSVVKFIITFILNSLSFGLSFYLIILCITSLSGVGMYFAAIGVFMVLLGLTFGIALLFYKPKGVKKHEIFNWKTILQLLLAGFVVYLISYLLVALIYFFSDIVGLMLSLPVLIITSIIVENIVIAYITDYDNIKNSKEKIKAKITTKKEEIRAKKESKKIATVDNK